MIRLLRAYAPALLWAAVVLYIGGRRGIGLTVDVRYIDKAAHFLMYGILGALAGWGWLRAGRVPAASGWIILSILLLGAADEIRQAFLPSRSMELADWIADASGAVLGFIWITRRDLRSRKRKIHEP